MRAADGHDAAGTDPGGPGQERPPRGGLRSRLRVHSVAGQVFVCLLVVVALLVGAALTTLVLQARSYATGVAARAVPVPRPSPWRRPPVW